MSRKRDEKNGITRNRRAYDGMNHVREETKMTRKRKELPQRAETEYPRLSEGEREPIRGIFLQDQKKGKRLWQRIYMASTAIALVLSLCLMSFLIGSYSDPVDLSDVKIWISNLLQNGWGASADGEDGDEGLR